MTWRFLFAIEEYLDFSILLFLYAYVRETPWLEFLTCSRIFDFEFNYSFYSIRQGKFSSILCGPPISVEMDINYPYLHSWPQSLRMWAYRIPSSRTLLFLISIKKRSRVENKILEYKHFHKYFSIFISLVTFEGKHIKWKNTD